MAGAFRSYLGTGVHQSGAEFVKWNLGMGKYAGRGVGRLVGPAFLAANAYSGYKEGGAWGAVKGAGKSLATDYAFGAILKATGIGQITTGLGIGVGASVAGVVGVQAAQGISPIGQGSLFSMAVRPLVAAHMKRQAELEMGRPVIDQFGTLATMRQRSIAAIQNSRINGRSALGNEAALQYRPYFR